MLARPSRSIGVLGGDASSASVLAGADGEGVEVVGEDPPGGPGLLAVVVLQPAAALPIAAFEVADPALGAGAVASQASLRAPGAGLLAAGDERPFGLEVVQRVAGGPGLNPPSSATSRGRRRNRSSSRTVSRSSVSSCGLPIWLAAGRISPRHAALGVLGDLADLRDVPELVGLAELALAEAWRRGRRSTPAGR